MSRETMTPAGVWTIEIPGWRPTLASEMKCHPMKAARLKKRDAEQMLNARLAFGVPPATGPRRVRFVITGRYSTFPDPDAPLKSGLDALKRAMLIVDDSAEWCDWEKPEYRRGPKGTVIVIEDVLRPDAG